MIKRGKEIQLQYIRKKQWIRIGSNPEFYTLGKILDYDKRRRMPMIKMESAVTLSNYGIKYKPHPTSFLLDRFRFYHSSEAEFKELRAHAILESL